MKIQSMLTKSAVGLFVVFLGTATAENQAASSSQVQDQKDGTMTLGASKASKDGSGTIEFKRNTELSPDALSNYAKRYVQFTNGASYGDVVANGETASLSYKNAKPNEQVVASVPKQQGQMLASESGDPQGAVKPLKKQGSAPMNTAPAPGM